MPLTIYQAWIPTLTAGSTLAGGVALSPTTGSFPLTSTQGSTGATGLRTGSANNTLVAPYGWTGSDSRSLALVDRNGYVECALDTTLVTRTTAVETYVVYDQLLQVNYIFNPNPNPSNVMVLASLVGTATLWGVRTVTNQTTGVTTFSVIYPDDNWQAQDTGVAVPIATPFVLRIAQRQLTTQPGRYEIIFLYTVNDGASWVEIFRYTGGTANTNSNPLATFGLYNISGSASCSGRFGGFVIAKGTSAADFLAPTPLPGGAAGYGTAGKTYYVDVQRLSGGTGTQADPMSLNLFNSLQSIYGMCGYFTTSAFRLGGVTINTTGYPPDAETLGEAWRSGTLTVDTAQVDQILVLSKLGTKQRVRWSTPQPIRLYSPAWVRSDSDVYRPNLWISRVILPSAWTVVAGTNPTVYQTACDLATSVLYQDEIPLDTTDITSASAATTYCQAGAGRFAVFGGQMYARPRDDIDPRTVDATFERSLISDPNAVGWQVRASAVVDCPVRGGAVRDQPAVAPGIGSYAYGVLAGTGIVLFVNPDAAYFEKHHIGITPNVSGHLRVAVIGTGGRRGRLGPRCPWSPSNYAVYTGPNSPGSTIQVYFKSVDFLGYVNAQTGVEQLTPTVSGNIHGSGVGSVLLTANTVGAALNYAVTEAATNVRVTPMRGGDAGNRAAGGIALVSDANQDVGANPADGGTVTINGTAFEFDSNGATTPGNVRVAIGATWADTARNLAAAINASSLGSAITATFNGDPITTIVFRDHKAPGLTAANTQNAYTYVEISDSVIGGCPGNNYRVIRCTGLRTVPASCNNPDGGVFDSVLTLAADASNSLDAYRLNADANGGYNLQIRNSTIDYRNATLIPWNVTGTPPVKLVLQNNVIAWPDTQAMIGNVTAGSDLSGIANNLLLSASSAIVGNATIGGTTRSGWTLAQLVAAGLNAGDQRASAAAAGYSANLTPLNTAAAGVGKAPARASTADVTGATFAVRDDLGAYEAGPPLTAGTGRVVIPLF